MADRKILITIDAKGADKTSQEIQKVAAANRELRRDVAAANTEQGKQALSQERVQTQAAKTSLALQKLATEAERTALAKDKLSRSLFSMAASMTKGILAAQAISTAIGTITSTISFSIKAAIDYEFALAKFQAVTGSSTQTTASFRDKIDELAASSNKAKNEIADAALEMSKIGLSTLQVEAAIKPVVDLSTALDEDLSVTATTVVGIMNAFSKSASDIPKIADELAFTVKNSALSIQTFGIAFGYVGGTANAAKVEFTELSGAMQVLSNSGIKASTIGTQLRRIMADLSNENSKASKAAGGTIESYGGLGKALEALGEKTTDAADMTDIFGRTASSVASILVRNTSLMERYARQTKEAKDLTGEMAKITGDTMNGALNRLSNSWQNLTQSLGTGNGFIKDSISWLGQLLNKISDVEKRSNLRKEYEDSLTRKGQASPDGWQGINGMVKPKGESFDSWLKQRDILIENLKIMESLKSEMDAAVGTKTIDDESRILKAILESTAETFKKSTGSITADTKTRIDVFNEELRRSKESAEEKVRQAKIDGDLLDVKTADNKEYAQSVIINYEKLKQKVGDYCAEDGLQNRLLKEEKLADLEYLAKETDRIEKKKIADAIRNKEKQEQDLAKFNETKGSRSLAVKQSLAATNRSKVRGWGGFLKSEGVTGIEDQIAMAREKMGEALALEQEGSNQSILIRAEANAQIAALEAAKWAMIKGNAKAGLDSATSDLETMATRWKSYGPLYKSIAIAKTTIDTYTAAQGAYASMASIPIVGPILGVAAAAAALGAGIARVQAIRSQKFATGTDQIVRKPTTITVGESGAERVQVTPRAKKASTEAGKGLTVVIQGDVYGAEKFNNAVNIATKRINGRDFV